ncbi:MAG TPA: hypothetical protein VFA59_19610 [Vicinamibacterales bacterium]|nr:hypothetical protein [Vicinamibacterales bacterium]
MTVVRPIFVATLIGVIGGWIVGSYVWLYAFYFIVMRPQHIPFEAIDQGAIPVIATGPGGAIIGGFLGARAWKRAARIDK